MKTRKAYDTSVVFLYATGKEHLLPLKFRRSIPYATISDWRHKDYSRYLGHEFRRYFEHAFDQLEVSAAYVKAKEALWAAARSWNHLKSLFIPLIKEAGNDKRTQKNVLRSINAIRSTFGLKRTLKLFGISHTLYRQWMIESQFNCFDSFTAICTRRHPHQLSKEEVLAIKKLLSEYTFDHWPIVSVAAHGLRSGKMIASLHSWYKYARLLGITKKTYGKELKTVGLVGTYPNEYWHVDTTFYPLIDQRTVCIAFVMDNYSKMILGFHVMENRTFSVVKEALRQSVTLALNHPGEKSTILIADGGSENHNKNIQDFIDRLANYKVTKLRALKDITFSNSPVEAIHRTIKGRYLRGRKFESIKALIRYLEWAVNDYNEVRPHYKHRPRTPHEVYYNIPLDFDMYKRKREALAARLRTNKCVSCKQCTEFNEKKMCNSNHADCTLRSTEVLVSEKPERR